MPNLYSIPEHNDTSDARRPRTPARPSTAGETSTYRMYPETQRTRTERKSSLEAPPILNRPQKLSGTLRSSWATGRLQGPAGASRTRSSSWGNGFNHDQVDPYTWRLTYVQPPKPTSAPNMRRSSARVGDLFASLPGEILDVILQMLKQIHLENGSGSCATCWMRDACNVAVCCRRWSKAARLALYQDIQLVGPDSAAHKKKLKLIQGCRMALLRRTLRANAEIASIVRSLRVPSPAMTIGTSNTKGSTTFWQYEDNVAALVMACPNLERLLGPAFTYDHSFKRLFHALSTRSNLRDMNWLIGSPCLTTQQAGPAPSKDCPFGTSNELQPHQVTTFLERHRGWTRLTSLSVRCLAEATLAPQTLLAKTLTLLPSLQHLHLCNLAPSAFNDVNLLALPPLQSLTLSSIRGISCNGLSSFATRSASRPLRRLLLRHTPLTSLPALARIFSNLQCLSSFSLVQTFPPLMPESDTFTLWMMPYLASTSVKKLHWDITSHPECSNAADDILARSIKAGGFPSLKTLRAPNDPDGLFQELCRPVERVDLPSDRLRTTSMLGYESLPSSPTKHLVKSPTTSSLPCIMTVSPHTNLVLARLAAQARLDRSRDSHVFQVNVTDEQGDLVETFGLAGYIGTVGSQVHYDLLPDEGSSDDKGGLVDVPDLHDDPDDCLAMRRGGCTGSWNWREGVVADKREKERWWHTERARWRQVEL
ncbi:uncharacterized protein MAM_01848 [Metarhizium album ARSEF 1941]|uniref:F-box domain-containing protein n=1 Tax=Metarhizium album (strain ARSEF 1941) TaxID=1081103 RepID=A0A0B2X3C4_METAS|nr:uncharacterized protein MAM_01848 [Metarhizium album ARSEF 1941]KHN99924.1 hypothetical protein MAM_01848 [Metarhizium album ARSEF 1941]